MTIGIVGAILFLVIGLVLTGLDDGAASPSAPSPPVQPARHERVGS
jgi:hypothetical protein